ncbi:MAG: phosphoribosylamine--glycine ligase [Candidatus Omnitrophica bacterium]|nr:phosphoribosylamine--glycine ligase [Candidatus Omnitrophota bacterium]
MRLLVIGSGGREHCLIWKLAQSSRVSKIFCAPGNGGTSNIAENVNISAEDSDGLLSFAKAEKIDLTIVGPEVPLVGGLVDLFESQGLKIFGPNKACARLEDSKAFSKTIMKECSVLTADFEIFDDSETAKEYIRSKGVPIVVKADGLAAGKGVIVCHDLDQALSAVDEIMVNKKFASSGEKIVVEQCLTGEEASLLVFTDGQTIIPLVSSQDHKAVYDQDKGPNTGGMGSYAPAPVVGDGLYKKIIDEVFRPVIEGLKRKGHTYKGMLYAGIMIDSGRPYVLEFNVRFGDPETQVLLPKLKSDLVDVMLKTIEGKLNEVTLEWDTRNCLCVVLTSGGYPGNYKKGDIISGLDQLENLDNVFVFHAGTIKDETGRVLTNGGRVLNVVALADNLKQAQDRVYSAIDLIKFDRMHYRKDIANKALKF